MYNGIKRKTEKIKLRKVNDKFQMLTAEEVEENGIVTTQYVFKTKTYRQDKTITWKDFEIANLKAAGIDVTKLSTTILPADIEKLSSKAANCEAQLDAAQAEQTELEILKAIENESTQQQPTEQAPQ